MLLVFVVQLVVHCVRVRVCVHARAQVCVRACRPVHRARARARARVFVCEHVRARARKAEVAPQYV